MSKSIAKPKMKLPESFRHLLWSYRFSEIDIEEHKKTIIVNVLNYGDMDQWRWLIKTYGRKQLKEIIESLSASEFRKPVVILLFLLLGIKFKYVSRSDKIRAEKNI
ncbi:MAG: hypothetical protein Q7R84_02305 [bacterium]|nr:hypothetical protein [bacterium]